MEETLELAVFIINMEITLLVYVICAAVIICGETGASAKLIGGLEYTYSSNSTTDPGMSHSTCMSGSGAFGIGAAVSGCVAGPTSKTVGQLPGQTFGAAWMAGGGGGVSFGKCTTLTLF